MGGFDENSAGAETTRKRWGVAAAAAAPPISGAGPPLGKRSKEKLNLEIAFGALLSGS